jgi:hypothetical protein
MAQAASCHKQRGTLWANVRLRQQRILLLLTTHSPYSIASGLRVWVSARGQLVKGMDAFTSRERKPTKSLDCWATLFFLLSSVKNGHLDLPTRPQRTGPSLVARGNPAPHNVRCWMMAHLPVRGKPPFHFSNLDAGLNT